MGLAPGQRLRPRGACAAGAPTLGLVKSSCLFSAQTEADGLKALLTKRRSAFEVHILVLCLCCLESSGSARTTVQQKSGRCFHRFEDPEPIWDSNK